MYLLDTHIAVWLVNNRARLSPGEFAVILDPDNEIVVSSVSIWEIRIKWHSFFSSGERKGPMDPLELLTALQRMDRAVLALEPDHCAAQLHHPLNHDDPFDELLLTIAQEMDCKLLTRDKKIRGHPLAYHAD